VLVGLAARAGAAVVGTVQLKMLSRQEKDMKYSRYVVFASLSFLGACAVVPTGPSVMALPGTGKTFDQFRADDNSCRQYAFEQAGGVSTNQAATTSAVGSAAIGTALGAAAGAAFNGGSGAAVGAGVGLLTGSLFGAGAAQSSAYAVQQHYDYAYLQCMYASGDRVPVSGHMHTMAPAGGGYVTAPPPPPGSPPPPPGAY
jgi:Glycine-zipper domain